MYKKVCPNCNMTFRAKDWKQVCCSRECANKYATVRAKVRAAVKANGPIIEYDGEYEWVRGGDGKYACRYNEACYCHTRACDSCGWNPKVAEERTKAVRCKLWQKIDAD